MNLHGHVTVLNITKETDVMNVLRGSREMVARNVLRGSREMAAQNVLKGFREMNVTPVLLVTMAIHVVRYISHMGNEDNNNCPL